MAGKPLPRDRGTLTLMRDELAAWLSRFEPGARALAELARMGLPGPEAGDETRRAWLAADPIRLKLWQDYLAVWFTPVEPLTVSRGYLDADGLRDALANAGSRPEAMLAAMVGPARALLAEVIQAIEDGEPDRRPSPDPGPIPVRSRTHALAVLGINPKNHPKLKRLEAAGAITIEHRDGGGFWLHVEDDRERRLAWDRFDRPG